MRRLSHGFLLFLINSILFIFFYKVINKYKNVSSPEIQNKTDKIFCIVVTYKQNFHTKAKSVLDTWGKECDKLFFIARMSTTEHAFESTEYNEPLPILEPRGRYNDSYDLLTIKMFSTFSDLYNRYDNYDWYLKADDDTYIFMQNLRNFLSNKKPDEPITYGCNLKYNDRRINVSYQSGGAGYVLSREALKRIGRKLSLNSDSCFDTEVEDIDVAECYSDVGVRLGVSKDEFDKERFHPFSYKHHLKGVYPDWFKSIYPSVIKDNVSKIVSF